LIGGALHPGIALRAGSKADRTLLAWIEPGGPTSDVAVVRRHPETGARHLDLLGKFRRTPFVSSGPLEIAQAILYLTSSESSFITGAALAVDGGRTLH